jgi:hypothetical protein
MSRIPLDVPPGLNTDDTAYASSPAWADMNNARFRLGRPQADAGFESVIEDLLGGVCRSVFPWTDNDNVLNIGFGTHQTLELYQGGALYDITPSSGFTAGQIDGTGTTGFGTGAYGIGGYGEPSATDYFPLTWSHGSLGQTLIASPRNQTIFQWSNNTASPAAALSNAPDNVTYMLVVRDFVFALGCNEEVGAAFNPLCIRHSDVRGPNAWSTVATSSSTSREYILPGGGRIVAGRKVGRSFLVWTNHNLFLATYVGSINKIWEFNEVGDKCGLIGPGAAVVKGSTAYWISPDRQFHTYTLGGSVSSIPCPIRESFADNLAYSQADKIVASTIAEYSEVRFDYPDARDGFENSRFIRVCVESPDAGEWSKGDVARTSMVDAGPSSYPCGTTYAGNVYWHEKGNSADGDALDGFIETADIYMDNDRATLVRGCWPDIAEQVGPWSLTLTGRDKPQGSTNTFGPYAMAPGEDKLDFKASGRLFRIRFSWASAPAGGRLGMPSFDVKLRGRK